MSADIIELAGVLAMVATMGAGLIMLFSRPRIQRSEPKRREVEKEAEAKEEAARTEVEDLIHTIKETREDARKAPPVENIDWLNGQGGGQ